MFRSDKETFVDGEFCEGIPKKEDANEILRRDYTFLEGNEMKTSKLEMRFGTVVKAKS